MSPGNHGDGTQSRSISSCDTRIQRHHKRKTSAQNLRIYPIADDNRCLSSDDIDSNRGCIVSWDVILWSWIWIGLYLQKIWDRVIVPLCEADPTRLGRPAEAKALTVERFCKRAKWGKSTTRSIIFVYCTPTATSSSSTCERTASSQGQLAGQLNLATFGRIKSCPTTMDGNYRNSSQSARLNVSVARRTLVWHLSGPLIDNISETMEYEEPISPRYRIRRDIFTFSTSLDNTYRLEQFTRPATVNRTPSTAQCDVFNPEAVSQKYSTFCR